MDDKLRDILQKVNDEWHYCFENEYAMEVQVGCECGCGGDTVDWDEEDAHIEAAEKAMDEAVDELREYFKNEPMP